LANETDGYGVLVNDALSKAVFECVALPVGEFGLDPIDRSEAASRSGGRCESCGEQHNIEYKPSARCLQLADGTRCFLYGETSDDVLVLCDNCIRRMASRAVAQTGDIY
jgi:hypothetical protein